MIKFFSLTFVMFLFCTPVMAAQDAMVTVEQASIREKPTKDSAILESKKAGAKLRISTYSKDGWYKTRTSSGQFGWIWQADLTVIALRSDVQTANLELKEHPREDRRTIKEPWIFVRGGGFIFAMLSTEISQRLGLGTGRMYFAPGAFAEVAVKLEDRLRLALRGGTYSASKSTLKDGVQYKAEFSGTPLMLGLDADITQGEFFEFSAGVYAGLGISNSTKVTATNLPVPNSFLFTGTSVAALLNFSGKYWVSRTIAMVGEFGIFYSNIPRSSIKEPGFNGDQPFRNQSNALSSFTVNHVGPILGIGAQIGF